ncbi:glycosyltransferase family 4 protein [Bergeyella porcorum]|uniref:glycosyltransferase family 4 protein n=1 Tax=Bergeyella porcorum TaxID=1735111 RepID=UPI0035F01C16
MQKKVLHIVTISFVIKHFFGEQFKYLKNKTGNEYYLACSSSDELQEWKEELNYIPIPTEITREISPIKDIKAIYRLVKVMRREEFDVVVAHTPKGGIVGMVAAYIAGVENRIYFRHGIAYETSVGLKKFILKNIERISGLLAHKVVNVSYGVKNFSIKDRLNAKDKNIILGKGTCNGVDALKRFNPNSYTEGEIENLRKKYEIKKDDFVIGYVGRLVHDKGIDDIIDAWKEIETEKKYQNLKLLLVGPFEEKDSVRKDVREYIYDSKTIIYTDYVRDAAPFFRLMNVFILPTYREGFPTVSLEASSMALPIVITRATGCEEAIIDGKTGVFILNEKESIKKAIEFYRNNPDICIEHGIEGRKFILENFEQTIVWDIINNKLKY